MRIQRGNSHLTLLRGNYQPRTLDLARDIMQLHVYLGPLGRHHPAGNYSLLPDPNHTCSHDVTRTLKKKKPRNPRGSPREHGCSARP